MLPVLLGCHVWNTQQAPRTYRIFVNRLFHLSAAMGVCFYLKKSSFRKVVVISSLCLALSLQNITPTVKLCSWGWQTSIPSARASSHCVCSAHKCQIQESKWKFGGLVPCFCSHILLLMIFKLKFSGFSLGNSAKLCFSIFMEVTGLFWLKWT